MQHWKTVLESQVTNVKIARTGEGQPFATIIAVDLAPGYSIWFGNDDVQEVKDAAEADAALRHRGIDSNTFIQR